MGGLPGEFGRTAHSQETSLFAEPLWSVLSAAFSARPNAQVIQGRRLVGHAMVRLTPEQLLAKAKRDQQAAAKATEKTNLQVAIDLMEANPGIVPGVLNNMKDQLADMPNAVWPKNAPPPAGSVGQGAGRKGRRASPQRAQRLPVVWARGSRLGRPSRMASSVTRAPTRRSLPPLLTKLVGALRNPWTTKAIDCNSSRSATSPTASRRCTRWCAAPSH